MKISARNTNRASFICQLPVEEAIDYLESNEIYSDIDGVWSWGDYDFFQLEGSKKLTWEA